MKKHGKSHYGYKNRVNVDRRHKLIRRYKVTDASVHDSRGRQLPGGGTTPTPDLIRRAGQPMPARMELESL